MKKILQYAIIDFLTIATAIGLMFGTVIERNAQATRIDLAPQISVNKIGQFKGQFLTAYYVLGSRPFLATQSNQIQVDKIKAVKTLSIEHDTEVISPQSIEKENLRGSYNFVILVISVQAQPLWINPDGSIPAGQASSLTNDNRQFSVVNVISKQDLIDKSEGELNQVSWDLQP